jgi:hypothetical protein
MLKKQKVRVRKMKKSEKMENKYFKKRESES